MRTGVASSEVMSALLVALTPPNRLAVEMSMRYGMRIGDVLCTKTEDVRKGRWTYKEEKTGKSRRITLSAAFQSRLLQQAGRIYCFEHRTDYKRHRSRQAVYKDIKRAARAFRVDNIAPHSYRKKYAVEAYHRSGDIKKVQRLLNHSSEAVTMLYALADNISCPKKRRAQKK